MPKDGDVVALQVKGASITTLASRHRIPRLPGSVSLTQNSTLRLSAAPGSLCAKADGRGTRPPRPAGSLPQAGGRPAPGRKRPKRGNEETAARQLRSGPSHPRPVSGPLRQAQQIGPGQPAAASPGTTELPLSSRPLPCTHRGAAVRSVVQPGPPCAAACGRQPRCCSPIAAPAAPATVSASASFTRSRRRRPIAEAAAAAWLPLLDRVPRELPHAAPPRRAPPPRDFPRRKRPRAQALLLGSARQVAQRVPARMRQPTPQQVARAGLRPWVAVTLWVPELVNYRSALEE